MNLELSNGKIAQTIDALLEEQYFPDEPGASVVVMIKGKPVYRRAIGMANLELSVKLEPNMVFRIGSITKQFTAVSILMLVEQNKIALDDSVTDYLPDFPTQNHLITIRHLLTYTAGIMNYTNMPSWPQNMREDLSLGELIAFFKDQPICFKPGEKSEYSNSGYVLLGAIIEKVSGLSYEAFLQEHIFTPLDMQASYYDHAKTIIPNRISGYDKVECGYQNAPYLSMNLPYAAGAIASTVGDLAKWDAALYGEELLKNVTLAQAFKAGTQLDGRLIQYGFGWLITDYEGFQFVEHGGGINGFLSYAIRIPEQQAYVAVLSNNTSIDPSELCLKIAAHIIGKPYHDPVAIELESDVLSQYVGLYKTLDGEDHYIELKDGKLFSGSNDEAVYELSPFDQDLFYYNANKMMSLRFKRSDHSTVTELEVYNRTGYSEIALRQF